MSIGNLLEGLSQEVLAGINHISKEIGRDDDIPGPPRRRPGAARSVRSGASCVPCGNVFEQSPNHRHRNLKAFEEHIQKHDSYCFVAEQYV